jgi:hypothetical protein
MSRLAVVFAVLSVVQPAFAQTSPASRATATARFGALRPAQPNPYAKLFDARPLSISDSQLSNKGESKRTVVCGLTIVQGDPQIDPKIFVTKKNDTVDYTLRKVEPPLCKS